MTAEREEGTFTICSFWLVSALSRIGEHERARALCAKLLSLASPLQLYAEEIDAASGMHLGNFPQAFTHLALIDAVLRVIAADEADPVATTEPATMPVRAPATQVPPRRTGAGTRGMPAWGWAGPAGARPDDPAPEARRSDARAAAGCGRSPELIEPVPPIELSP